MYQDPYFQDVPWEIYYDESGQVIGTVFVLLPKTGRKETNVHAKHAWGFE